METSQLQQGVSQLVGGHVALVACSVLYLIWWWAFFRPEGDKPAGVFNVLAIACIVGAAIAGLLGVIAIVTGDGTLADATGSEAAGASVPGWTIAAGGVVAYVLLLIVTLKAFDRQPTTELFLIVGWATLELVMVNTLSATGAFPGVIVPIIVLVAVLFCASMVCYVLYYKLDPWPAFIDGCIPLVAVGIVSAVVVSLLR